MTSEIPLGVKYARVINFLSVIALGVIGFLMAAIAVPNFVKAAQNAGQRANPILLVVVGLISFAIPAVPAVLLLWLNKALAQLKKRARIWQIVVSCLLSFVFFPIGTVFYVIALYFMLFHSKTKQAFNP